MIRLSAQTLRRTLILLLTLAISTLLTAADFSYELRALQVAPDTYVFVGHNEYFNTRNGGNIVNTGFIVTGAGVVVIDSGPSLRYARQARQVIAGITRQPIVRVFITHAHPDHFLGNQAYPGATLHALPTTANTIRNNGNALAENMYRLAGDWMKGTEAVVPGGDIEEEVPLKLSFGKHQLRLLTLAGHTDGDLAVYDESTGTLFAGDLVFHDRAPTTPNAQIKRWLGSLDTLAALHARVLVPGHGAVTRDNGPIEQTRDYLQWLQQAMRDAAAQGLDMTEVLQQKLPARFAGMAVGHDEYQRSVGHLYPAAEQSALRLSGSMEEQQH